ncbi:hypothetical protein JCM33374_g6091 [Metschnikowia sp. JCM 33374]|nr:hypothetical protein JCM33374_g6091 [Metschnikowia sp. JCM 33374]
MKLDEAENQAGQEERREKRQTECLDEHQPKRQNKDHPRNLPITNMYHNYGDLYEFFECCDELIPLYGTAEFEPLRQKIIERGWYLPMRAWRYYHTVLGVDYEYPAPRDPPN